MLRCPSDSCHGKSSAVKFPAIFMWPLSFLGVPHIRRGRHSWLHVEQAAAVPAGFSCFSLWVLAWEGVGGPQILVSPVWGQEEQGPARGMFWRAQPLSKPGHRPRGPGRWGRGGIGTLAGLLEQSPVGPEAFGRLHAALSFGKLPPASWSSNRITRD